MEKKTMRHIEVKNVKTHDLAQCSMCGWTWDWYTDKGNGTQKCQAHANKTGHVVTREIGRATHYHKK